MATSCNASLASLITAATSIYVYRLTGERDMVFATPVMGRSGPAAKNPPTLLSNVLPVRIQLRPPQTLGSLLHTVGRNHRETMRHQMFPELDLRDLLQLNARESSMALLSVNNMCSC